LAKDTVLYGISHILPRLVNFIFVASFLSYTISKEEYGKFNTVYGYITAIIAIITFRMDTAYFRYANNEEKDRRDQVYSTTILPVFIIATIVLILLWVGAPNLDKVLDLNVGSHVIRWMSAVVWLDAFTTIMYSKYRLDRRPVKFLALRVLNVLIIVCLVMFFILAFRQYFPSLASQFDSFIGVKKSIDYVYLANLIASLMIFLAMVPDMLKIKYRIDKSLISKIFSYTWPLTVVSFAGVFNSYMTIPMVSYFSGGGEVGSANAGIYSAGLKLATLLNLFITAYNYAAEPFFFNQSKNADSKKYTEKLLWCLPSSFVW
jgi:O-antigen/teichoic acid export membrane protein